MADNTRIEWTEATWNPITGCSLASPGCTNCYAMRFAGTRLGHVPKYDGLTQPSKAGPVWTGKLAFDEKALLEPLRWKKPRMVFVNSMGDLFHEDCPDEWIDRVFAVMALCPQHTFQVLTKRSARMREYCQSRFETEWGSEQLCEAIEEIDQFNSDAGGDYDAPLPNVWLGVSVEDQQRADERIPDLLATPAAIRWISAEPLLGPVNITDAMFACEERLLDDLTATIDWVVAGGESGKHARPMHPDWARSLRDQCAAAEAPFFFKQWGEWRPYSQDDDFTANDPTGEYGSPGDRARHVPAFAGDEASPDNIMIPVGKKRAGRLLDGVEHNGMPEQFAENAKKSEVRR